MRPCHAILLFVSTVCLPVAGHCDTARIAVSDASRITQAQHPEQEGVSAPETGKSFRGFFGYLEYDFDPDEPVPGFGPLPQSTQEIAQVRVE
jgi:hypothetical protein